MYIDVHLDGSLPPLSQVRARAPGGEGGRSEMRCIGLEPNKPNADV